MTTQITQKLAVIGAICGAAIAMVATGDAANILYLMSDLVRPKTASAQLPLPNWSCDSELQRKRFVAILNEDNPELKLVELADPRTVSKEPGKAVCRYMARLGDGTNEPAILMVNTTSSGETSVEIKADSGR